MKCTKREKEKGKEGEKSSEGNGGEKIKNKK
jgi:hypothetical protein